MGDLSVKYGFYSAEWDLKPHGAALPMGEGMSILFCYFDICYLLFVISYLNNFRNCLLLFLIVVTAV